MSSVDFPMGAGLFVTNHLMKPDVDLITDGKLLP